MAKDPAFLFYSKDWLEGTMEMTPAEKGVYIDLLAHQHQKGSLPSEIKRLSKLTGLSEEHFLEIWQHLQDKFVSTDGNRLVNRKLTEIVTDRSAKSLTNRITGTLASVIRLSTAPPEIKEKIKKTFKTEDFYTVPTDSLTESITKWFSIRLKSIGNGNANENGNEQQVVGGMGEEGWNPKPGKKELGLLLPEDQKTAAIELMTRTSKVNLTPEDIDGLWNVFKTQNFTGEQFYQSKHKVYTHFPNWLKIQKFEKNGSKAYSSGSNSRGIDLSGDRSKTNLIDIPAHNLNRRGSGRGDDMGKTT